MHWIDPDYLPETLGVVDRLLLNPDGEADGFLLSDGMEVHFPPHMAPAVLSEIRIGSEVRVRGVRPRTAPMIAAVAIAARDGAPIVDQGPDAVERDREGLRKDAKARRREAEIEGIVRQPLHGPKGEVRGLMLEDGRSARFPAGNATALDGLMAPGARVVIRGMELATDHGSVVAVQEIGASRDTLHPLAGKKDKGARSEPRSA